MAAQRDHLVGALMRIVAEADRPELGPFLVHLAIAHRKFGVIAAHHASLRVSLLATLEHFEGEAWAEVAADWDEAIGVISKHMTEAAAADEEHAPAWWDARVLGREQRAFDVTVLHVAADPDGPGQSVAVETPARPRLWRYYSPANPPDGSGVLEFHVRQVDGGQVSPALASLQPGDPLRIGPPAGTMTLEPSGRPVLMAGWSTGLAPLKAILRQVQGLPFPPAIHLFTGARRPEGLYDMPALEAIAARCPWLTLTPVVAESRGWPGETGWLHEVIARRGEWAGWDAYLAGPGEMVTETAKYLAAAGTPAEHVHAEDFGWGERS
jgi:NAD(P)H-flavin reductase